MKARIIAEVKIVYNPEINDPLKNFSIQKKIFFIEVKKWFGWKKYGNIKDITFSITPIFFDTYEEAEKYLLNLMFKDHCKVIIKNNEYEQEKYGAGF